MSRKLDLYKVVKMGMKALKRANIPLYWSKYSRKDYTLHQHMMLIVLTQYVGSIERMLQIVREMRKIKRVMRLKKIPHKSTISRELRRIPERWIRIVLREIVKIMGIPNKFAVDSTGIQIYYRSYYYTQRIGEVGKIREGLKLHAAVDIERKLITNAIVTKWHTNDSPYLIPLLEEERVKEVYADKGYDSLRNIRFVLNKGGTPYIAIRNKARRGLRRRLLEKSKSPDWKKKYSHRNVIESVFHSFKRVVGDYIFSHSFSGASKLLLFKVLAYDLYV
ncbi:transposase [Candidatus Aciduliprofundum boonei]|uniref:Transposase IS4 family protein n=1 Tax=Aciduliprofundum boonei (strain DSM 19572 / T469) TaxID=439481 RepID=B5IAN7_ACIB4|nr:transposase [Candidatus Aciduliprofundum boonei]ADD08362.1 transposase IS4 family protein [Aciduliprofundum boonei T469]ADD08602.1 transposase IS4 family protein [Aciduliprofundum boonei T469]ADD08973.1 transposase IS4 family protein [Aciduliprofundum boonei T469]ADD08991.1 transposase IS4 family protein [Aciduliprofundum boonei T469]EDY34928.1 Transposase, IS4 family protein [Aciduliprofundum boonei T469]